MQVAVGVRARKQELEGVDDTSIPPVCAEESAIFARLLAGLLKLGGRATDVVSGGGLRSGGGMDWEGYSTLKSHS